MIKQRTPAHQAHDLSGFPMVIQSLYRARGVTQASEVNYAMGHLVSFESLKGIVAAVERLSQAMIHQQKMMVIGDFDADGATSTALAVSALKTLGAEHVDFLVPNRFVFGYGLTPELVDFAHQRQPDLLITVDNGISSIEGVAHAQSLGMDVLVTDHHLAGDTLPNACAIVNPNQPGDLFPSKSLAGVGVIFYVMLALRRHLMDSKWFEQRSMPVPNMAAFLDLVALGTVADVVPLDHNNRILVKQGVERIRQGFARPGIKALMKIAQREPERLKPADLGFAIAPRLNAAGRLDDMSLGIQCLLAPTLEEAQVYAQQLDALNEERKIIEQDMKIQAAHLIQQLKTQLNQPALPEGMCLFDAEFHQGVIGILAGRLKETYHRPVIVFAQVSEQELKGSARSVSHVNIRDCLAQIHQDHPGLIIKFGGHAMAAGLSIHPEHFKLFQQAFACEIKKHHGLEQCQGEWITDGQLPAPDLTLQTAVLLEQAGPWGAQFPEPLFDGEFEVIEQRIVGQKHLKLLLKPIDGAQYLDAIAFNIPVDQWPNHRAHILKIVYTLDQNLYQNKTRLQLLIHHLEVAQILTPTREEWST